MPMIQALCPASCGELIQGWIHGSEKLISYGINCYSRVSISEGKGRKINQHPKAYQMVQRIFRYYDIPIAEAENIVLNIESEIPLGKGMASSTADLGATALAAATYLNKKITQEEIASLCIEIEPTDSTLFSQITLFDHLKGSFIKPYGPYPQGNVLVLEGKQTIDTIEFRKTERKGLLENQAPQLEKALELFEAGINENSLQKLAQAGTISALANQTILYKKGLEALIQLCLEMGALGVNVAHSGTVIGIIFDEGFDHQRFLHAFQTKDYSIHYQSAKVHQMVSGGAILL